MRVSTSRSSRTEAVVFGNKARLGGGPVGEERVQGEQVELEVG